MYGYIYRITDTLTGKLYIGQHRYEKPELDPSYHGSGHIIKRIYNKRPETLLEEIIFIAATEDELNYFEQYFIEHLNTLHPNGYNLTTGGIKPKFTAEVKEKIRKAIKGKKRSAETKRKLSEAHIGLKQTYKTIEKRVSKLRGKPRPENVKKAIIKSLTKDIFTKEQLYEQFIIQNKSINECSKIFNCSRDLIIRRLKQFGIKKSKELYVKMLSNKTNKCFIDKEELYDLYINKNFSSREIANIYCCSKTPILRLLKKYGISKNI